MRYSILDFEALGQKYGKYFSFVDFKDGMSLCLNESTEDPVTLVAPWPIPNV